MKKLLGMTVLLACSVAFAAPGFAQDRDDNHGYRNGNGVEAYGQNRYSYYGGQYGNTASHGGEDYRMDRERGREREWQRNFRFRNERERGYRGERGRWFR